MVRDCFDAYQTSDRGLLEAAFAEDFTFTSQYDDAIDKAQYFERCWPNRHMIRAHYLEAVVEHGDEVFVRDPCTTTDGRDFRNVEVFRFAGGKVRQISVYFGAAYRNGAFIAAAAGSDD